MNKLMRVIGVVATMVSVVVVIIYSITTTEKITKEYFNARPTNCAEISNSLSLIPPAKLKTVYKNKITVYREYSPGKHLESYPDDVAIQTYIPGDKTHIVIILTNRELSDNNKSYSLLY